MDISVTLVVFIIVVVIVGEKCSQLSPPEKELEVEAGFAFEPKSVVDALDVDFAGLPLLIHLIA